MEHNKKTQTARLKGFLVTGIVTAAALVTMISVYQSIDSNQNNRAQMAQEAEPETGNMEMAQAEAEGSVPNTDVVEYSEIEYEDYEDTQQTMAEREVVGANGNAMNSTDDSMLVEQKDFVLDESKKAEVFSEETATFGAGSDILWPVSGNVLMNYSMDKTVYFATLDQYKYNPAIVIQAPVNTKVIAGVEGTIAEIDTCEDTGLTVTLNLGNDYQAIYGQLKEVNKGVGEVVAKEDVLGYVAEPTKYYNVEGSNLYFAMTKDGKPVNPMEFIK